MTTTPPKTETGITPHALPVASGATWDPPCLGCGNPIGITVPEGKYVARTKCDDCEGIASTQRLVNAGIPRWFIDAKHSLASFDDRQNTSLLRAISKAKSLVRPADMFDRIWLIFSGESGCGKSHLAAAVVQEFLDNGRTARFVTFDEILVEIMDSYNSSQAEGASDTTGEVIRRYTKEAYCLAIDDVGVEQPTAHAIQILYRILNARLNDRFPTVITTNYPLVRKRAGQPSLGERLSEKLSDDTPVRRILDRIGGDAKYEHIDATSYRRLPASDRQPTTGN